MVADNEHMLFPGQVATELILVQSLKEEVAALDQKLDSRVQSLSTDATALLNERSKWEAYIKSEHTKLQKDMQVEVGAEQQRMFTISDRLVSMGKAINGSKDFKRKVAVVLGQLKSELKDTSESLLMLDKKYSDQMDAVSARIQNLKDLQSNIANPNDMSEGVDQVAVRTEGVFDGLDDMKESIMQSRDRQLAQSDRQVELKRRLQDLTKHLTSTITLAQNHLARHPDLIERISCTCYEGFKLEGQCIAGSMDDQSMCEPCPAGTAPPPCPRPPDACASPRLPLGAVAAAPPCRRLTRGASAGGQGRSARGGWRLHAGRRALRGRWVRTVARATMRRCLCALRWVPMWVDTAAVG